MLALERMMNMRHVIDNLKNHKIDLEARKNSEKNGEKKKKKKEKEKASRKSQQPLKPKGKGKKDPRL